MCRVCYVPSLYVPSLLCAEFVMCRVDPAPGKSIYKYEFSQQNSTELGYMDIEHGGEGLKPSQNGYI